MSSIKRLAGALWALLLCAGMQSLQAQTIEVRCPSAITVDGALHKLANVAVFDGPPEEITDLVPDADGDTRRWAIDDSVNPYLVCRYQDWRNEVVLHAKGASLCEAQVNPLQAFCR